MTWPTPQDYNEAVQSPSLSFADPELRSGVVDLTSLGLPRPITGNFASVYRLRCRSGEWAVRCFWREYADMQRRYEAISMHLASAGLPYTLPFEYQPQGIKVRGTWYPLLKMQWADGSLLNEYVWEHRHHPTALDRLARAWLDLAAALEGAGLAHGDLQHGNVLVVNGDLKLVDYDGMFVPALAGAVSHETGHQNYQHPGRTGRHFGPSLDRFSQWSIYVGLRALGADPGLWDAVQGREERLLFHASDLAAPPSSPLFTLLRTHADPEVRNSTRRLESLRSRDPLDAPPLRLSPVRSRARAPLPAPTRTIPDWLQTMPEYAQRTESFVTVSPWPFLLAVLALLCAACVPLLLLFVGPLAGVALVPSCLALLLSHLMYRRDPRVRERLPLDRIARRAYWHARLLDVLLLQARRRRSAFARRASTQTDDGRLHGADARADKFARIAGDLRALLERDTLDLMAMEAAVLHHSLQAMQEEYVRRHLRRQHVLGQNGPPLGAFGRLQLWSRGIRNAAQVGTRASRLQRLGNHAAADVLAWRARCLAAAQGTRPQTLPEREVLLQTAVHRRILGRLQRQSAHLQVLQERFTRVLEEYEAESRAHMSGVRARRAAHSGQRLTRLQAQVDDIEGRRVAVGRCLEVVADARGPLSGLSRRAYLRSSFRALIRSPRSVLPRTRSSPSMSSTPAPPERSVLP